MLPITLTAQGKPLHSLAISFANGWICSRLAICPTYKQFPRFILIQCVNLHFGVCFHLPTNISKKREVTITLFLGKSSGWGTHIWSKFIASKASSSIRRKLFSCLSFDRSFWHCFLNFPQYLLLVSIYWQFVLEPFLRLLVLWAL